MTFATSSSALEKLWYVAFLNKKFYIFVKNHKAEYRLYLEGDIWKA